MNQLYFKERCKKIRIDIVDIVASARRGHINSAFSLVEILVTLYDKILKYDPANPSWGDRDRLILSKGHGCPALYALLSDKGFFPREHPERDKVPGVEASTGALGHGLAVGVGMAVAAKLDQKDYMTFVILGDGECNEGSIWEAALSANKNGLDNLVVLVDYNKYQSYGPTSEVLDLEPFRDKWNAFGFAAREVDMINEPEKLYDHLCQLPFRSGQPNAVICHTIKGQGVPLLEGNLEWHHKSRISDEEIALVLAELES